MYLLYIFDCKTQRKEILRIDPIGDLIKKWSIGHHFGHGISVTDESNVLLALKYKNKLNEYSPDGQLIREVYVSHIFMSYPRDAVRLINGHFVVISGTFGHDMSEPHRVCIVDSSGKPKKSFGGKGGSAIGEMKSPVCLAVDRNGFVMVVDQLNNRILLLDSDLEFKREIPWRKAKHRLLDPEKILLDESNGRLLVTEGKWSNAQISIFEFN